MKLKEYMDNLKKFVKENPDALEMEVITSKDDEGNGFNRVVFTPTKGFFDDGDFIPTDQLEEYGRKSKEINAVCVN